LYACWSNNGRELFYETARITGSRRVSIGAVAESAIHYGFLAPPAPGIGQSG
jgi:hypothetical protein